MLLTEESDFDIFVSSKIGSFKHIKYHTESSKNSKKCIENLVDIKVLQKDDAITVMEWADDEQTQIMLGRKNQQVEMYNTQNCESVTHSADFAPGHLIGLGRCKRHLLAGKSDGAVRIWSKKTDSMVQTGGKLDRMRICPDEKTIFGTGGEENDLKVWRIGEPAPAFSAKNLAHDWLQLRRPVWVSDLAFLPGGGAMVAVCSRHGYVRLYDTRAQRRPVINVDFQMAATCLTPGFDERQVIVGFGRGQLHQVDLRKARPDKGYKGSAGAITSITLALKERCIVSGSLDRHLRIHKHETKELIYKQYLTSKLSCVLVQNNNSTAMKHTDDVKEEKQEVPVCLKPEDELDLLFDVMETVGDKLKKKKHPEATTPSKKMKFTPSIEGSTIDLDATANEEGEEQEEDEIVKEEDEISKEDAIAKLLRSTEKKKRRLEKQKREKKAKSVFHNA